MGSPISVGETSQVYWHNQSNQTRRRQPPHQERLNAQTGIVIPALFSIIEIYSRGAGELLFVSSDES
jgi:hypothetical protein